MRTVDSTTVADRLQISAFNSSHYVWLLAKLTFLETTTGWIFATRQKLGIVFIALEPLPASKSFSEKDFIQAAEELEAFFPNRTLAWVAIGSKFIPQLSQENYYHLLIGKEPWVDLSRYEPKGKKSRGIRAARNQAIRANAFTEKWKISELIKNPTLMAEVDHIHQQWKEKTLVSMEGFLLSSNPWAFPENRWCFLAKNKDQKIEAVLIATPIVKNESWYLEDMWLDYRHTRGIGELIMLDAMEGLKKEGALEVSLGIVTGNYQLSQPGFFSKFTFILEKTLSTFYNANGLSLFRKRFNIAKWEPVYLSVKMGNGTKPTTLNWLKVLVGLTAIFEPKLYIFNLSRLWKNISKKFSEHPVSLSFAMITGGLFIGINRFGDLPEKVIRHFSFDMQAPWYEWAYRSITSDLLFFDVGHFTFLYPFYFILLYILENKQKLKFVYYFVILTHFLDDFINYFLIVKPFHFLQSKLYLNLVSSKDVGCSLGMVTVLGFLVSTQLRRTRELVLILVALGLVFGYAFHSHHFSAFILNLNHFLLFLLGYLAGKIKFELMRAESKKVAKRKPPLKKQPL